MRFLLALSFYYLGRLAEVKNQGVGGGEEKIRANKLESVCLKTYLSWTEISHLNGWIARGQRILSIIVDQMIQTNSPSFVHVTKICFTPILSNDLAFCLLPSEKWFLFWYNFPLIIHSLCMPCHFRTLFSTASCWSLTNTFFMNSVSLCHICSLSICFSL